MSIIDTQTLQAGYAGNLSKMKTVLAAKKQPLINDLPPAEAAKVRKTAEEFEAVFLTQMMGFMFEGVETDEMFGGGPAEDIFRSMMVDEYGKMLAKQGGIGLSDEIQDTLIRLQSQTSNATNNNEKGE